MDPYTSLAKLPGFGPGYLSRLHRLGIETAYDILYHFPFRYEDLSQVAEIANLKIGEVATVRGQVLEIKNIRTRTGKFLTKAIVNDGSGSIEVTWFNQPYLTKTIKSGLTISIAGKVTDYRNRLSFTSPDYELDGPRRHTGRIVPIYPETEGLTSKWLRNKVAQILPEVELPEVLPGPIVASHHLLPVNDAIRKIHQPESSDEIEASRRRFAFEEMFIFQLAALIRKSTWQAQKATPMKVDSALVSLFKSRLPFRLTGDQEKVLTEILGDMSRDRPMNRLLQGDVGSGKTVVAAAASYIAHRNGFQSVLMAPTEILAHQHYQTLTNLLTPLGLKVGLRTGSTKTDLGDVTVGTHALLSKSTEFKKLGLVVIDEQHRFGVSQRALLKSKGGAPHTLTMTATPIPRTLALTVYGDLDLSVIEEMPPGRKTVKTYLTPPEKRDKAYQFIREKVERGQQIFIITPLIEPSESLTTVKSVKEEYRRLSEEVFPKLRLGLLHGRMKAKEKTAVLDQFRAGELNILVATPVVEVGIDIPNATIMVIEGAERFGLAQLHQLRGRVGRGAAESWCLLFSEDSSEASLKRLRALEVSHSGASLADLDLKLRGPGELYGLRQSGLPDLKIASLQDAPLISQTRQAAQTYLDSRPKFSPELTSRLDPLLRFEVTPD